MHKVHSRMDSLGLACLSVLPAACGSGSSAWSPGVDALIGKRIPGTSASWHPVTASKAHVDLAGTTTPQVITYEEELGQIVALFEFPTSSSAASFYGNPQPAAHVVDEGPQTFVTLTGAGPVKSPS